MSRDAIVFLIQGFNLIVVPIVVVPQAPVVPPLAVVPMVVVPTLVGTVVSGIVVWPTPPTVVKSPKSKIPPNKFSIVVVVVAIVVPTKTVVCKAWVVLVELGFLLVFVLWPMSPLSPLGPEGPLIPGKPRWPGGPAGHWTGQVCSSWIGSVLVFSS